MRCGTCGADLVSNLEKALAQQIRCLKLPEPCQEYRFALEHIGPGKDIRKRLQRAGLKDWRFDFAWPDIRLAVEVEGITPSGGRHQRIQGFKGDIDKYHAAMNLGWNVYRTTGHLIANGKAVKLIEKLIINERIRQGEY